MEIADRDFNFLRSFLGDFGDEETRNFLGEHNFFAQLIPRFQDSKIPIDSPQKQQPTPRERPVSSRQRGGIRAGGGIHKFKLKVVVGA